MTLNLGLQHWRLVPFKVCSNDDPGLTFSFFKARPNLLPNAFPWENALPLDFIETINDSMNWKLVHIVN